MTLSRYLCREVLIHFVGVLTVVVGIFLAQRLDALLVEAGEGSISLGVAAELLALRTLGSLPSLVPVVLYLAIVLALGRLSRDRELAALASSGISPARVARPMITLGVVVSAAVAWLALEVRPWAATRLDQVEREARIAVDLEGLAPQRFYALDDAAGRVLFAERRAAEPGRALEGVLLHEGSADGDVSLLVSDRAIEERDPLVGDRVLRLLAGRRYDFSPDGGRLDVTDYAEYELRAPLDPETAEGGDKDRPTLELLASAEPGDQAELQWRLAMPVSSLLLVLAALPIGRGDPKSGKYGRLLAALVIYVAYRQALGSAKGLIAMGELPPLPGLWAVHAAFAVLAIALMAWRRRAPG